MTRYLHLLLAAIHTCSNGVVLDSPDEGGTQAVLPGLGQHTKPAKLSIQDS